MPDVAARPRRSPDPRRLSAAGAAAAPDVAGGELEFFDALVIGDDAKRTSKIADVTVKSGSTGTLCFVSVNHEVTTSRGLAVRERQDIVYREMTSTQSAAPTKAPPPPPRSHNTARAMSPIRCCCSVIRR